MVENLLLKTKDFLGITDNSYDTEIKIHINSALSILVVNNIIYENLMKEIRDLVDLWIFLNVKSLFDNDNSSTDRTIEREKTRVWYIITSLIGDIQDEK